mmetsp:Transcript_3286/g.6896  ORF Transcript_3286/g.6896 Transcript_3286/m.6896 type:complete len:123 (+) Transcript_3286:75-443(+)|eukprot:CAMPEP_0180470216 /NCGR_PEP_ID=MMETSP1036_2-20121128/28467_1 /TAXON_ID=632150 /ORGANISM="Azadinium spinosum, Strain 3D9" /LENGTH=122 /DNA_ID=CAMNT_0022477335 /DNA_START=55 /DNA_END=423 /DNA_ORIENTATION=-
MGCHRCMECGEKFEGYDADEYAAERSDCDTSDAECVEGDYSTCPACLQKERAQKQKDADLARFKQEAEMEKRKRLKAEKQLQEVEKKLQEANKKLLAAEQKAAAAIDGPSGLAAKRQKRGAA